MRIDFPPGNLSFTSLSISGKLSTNRIKALHNHQLAARTTLFMRSGLAMNISTSIADWRVNWMRFNLSSEFFSFLSFVVGFWIFLHWESFDCPRALQVHCTVHRGKEKSSLKSFSIWSFWSTLQSLTEPSASLTLVKPRNDNFLICVMSFLLILN